MPYRQNGQKGLIHGANTVFREERPLFVCEPLSCADLAARFGIVYARHFQVLVGVVQQRSAMQQLQIEPSIRALITQKFERSLEHGIPGGLGRQGYIQAAMPESSLQLQMCEESRLGLALAHWCFHQQDGGGL